ncbi:MAG: hypothetical protein IH845_05280 [Nanoarchaeota archaeon]|nr:hypothetical protein [Nanoarchaeota archaeon]
MENDDFDFEKEYKDLEDKYDLPKFESLAEDFDVEKIFEKESSFILREIRKAMSEKLYSYSSLLENLINPNSIPIFILSAIRNLTTDDKAKIKEIYKKLSSKQIEIMKLDTIYREECEAKFIRETFKLWEKLKPEIYEIIIKLEEKAGEESNSRERGYFG